MKKVILAAIALCFIFGTALASTVDTEGNCRGPHCLEWCEQPNHRTDANCLNNFPHLKKQQEAKENPPADNQPAELSYKEAMKLIESMCWEKNQSRMADCVKRMTAAWAKNRAELQKAEQPEPAAAPAVDPQYAKCELECAEHPKLPCMEHCLKQAREKPAPLPPEPYKGLPPSRRVHY